MESSERDLGKADVGHGTISQVRAGVGKMDKGHVVWCIVIIVDIIIV